MKPLPLAFRRRIQAVYGDSGQNWLQQLPNLREELIERWSLSELHQLPDLSYNYLAFARTESDIPVALKIGVPHPELTSEIKTLEFYQGEGMVRLLDAEPELGALLLERVLPGTTLAEIQDEDQAARIAGRSFSSLRKPAFSHSGFPTIADWFRGIDRYQAAYPDGDGPIPAKIVDRAGSLARDLLSDTQECFLLHGDLHHANLLFREDGTWILIDPKGVIGEAAFEAGSYLYNPIPAVLGHPNLDQLLERRLGILQEQTGLDFNRLASWGYCRAVLSAIWSVEDQQQDHTTGITIAGHLDKLIK